MKRKSKNRWAGFIIGPLLAFFALVALWKNETRFDYYRAAAATHVINSPDDGSTGQLISLTGPMNPELTFVGKYVESFTGYLVVHRTAEIYAWNRTEDDDGVDWDLTWMYSVEDNSRNDGIIQRLSSDRFVPPQYSVGELTVSRELIEFVDDLHDIEPTDLNMERDDLKVEEQFFYLRKHRANNLGDERISYTGIPVPAIATYFGKLDWNRGVADTTHRRQGFLNEIILDTGVLHHIVAGDRDTALATMKAHIQALKWLVRIIGTIVVIVGLNIICSVAFGLFFHLPLLGWLVEWGAFAFATVIGLSLATGTIVVGYMVTHSWVSLAFVGVLSLIAFLFYRRGKATQKTFKKDLDVRFGRSLSANELQELQFIELAQLTLSDSRRDEKELAFLQEWGSKQRWDQSKIDELIEKAQQQQAAPGANVSTEDHLLNLIRLSLADGRTSKYEMKSIRKVGKKLGRSNMEIKRLLSRVRLSAA